MQTLQDENAKLKEKSAVLKTERDKLEERGQKLENNFKRFKGNMDRLKTERVQLIEENNTLTSKIEALEAEKTSLLSDKATSAQSTSDAAQQPLEETSTTIQLTKEKEQLISERDALLNLKKENEELKAERDKLLTEKAAVGSTSTSLADGTIEEARRTWDSEKAELVKAREDALAKAKVAEDNYETVNGKLDPMKLALEQMKNRLATVHKGRQEDKAKAKSEQEAAIAAALEKQKAELQSTTTSMPADYAEKHAEELKALETRLAAKHEEELKAAVEAAKAEAAPSQHQLDAAVERGRMEVQKKLVLKDGQLIRSQSKLKDVETQIKLFESQVRQWHQQGFIPEKDFSSITQPRTSTVPAGALAASSSQPSTSTAPKPTPPTGPAVTSTASTSQTKPLPNKAPSGQPHRGRGGAPPRGTERGRGGLAARGRLAPAVAAAQGPSLSVLGAAAKRQREETANTSEDSLAKRLKTGDSQGSGPAAAKPVTIKRPPPPL
ncbi:uncharacterized protein BT62DRAFT_176800 [Guyanagaster necrorhizus]|uniref:Nucleoprotein TPR/MLP1 domain-containing protein n=1 Tax=Guyanagaster necrorhizus TaxID=856835 RepID=A0A9P7VQT8_9AGAR|nr:uncharacterized protein BT62DRAFT_176800 [Guyanagaster necrorhizus MCA 3950]KAG7445738.1 hypothetical protein BT62DRAFT_176800 [Guyanagaster necrorhizus MCA 3950]